VCPVALAFVANLIIAMIVFGLGGVVWAPFTPVACARPRRSHFQGHDAYLCTQQPEG
jgi:hypothetical protein